MAKATVGIVIVLLVLIGVAIFFVWNSSYNSNDGVLPQTGQTNKNTGDVNVVDSGNSNTPTQTKTFVLTGENFKFKMNGANNPTLRVNEGDKVKIEFSSVGGMHDWSLDEFNAKTEQVLESDGMTSVEFIADKKGTFEYYCSVGQHRQMGMKGKFVVE